MNTGHDQRGFLMLAAMFFLTGTLTLSSVGLGRSVIEMSHTQRTIASQQVFHTAEGALDLAYWQLQDADGDLTGQPGWRTGTSAEDPACTGPMRCWWMLWPTAPAARQPQARALVLTPPSGASTIRVRASAGGVERNLQARVSLGGGGPNPFDYAVLGTQINMDGNAIIGDPAARIPNLYAVGPPNVSGSFYGSGAFQVFADNVLFFNPDGYPPSLLCDRCSDPGTFVPAVNFNYNAPPLPKISIDLRPFYDRAVADGYHITSDARTASPFPNGVVPPGTYQGVMYVECGVNVSFDGAVTWNGTIVHEGCIGDLAITGRNANLTINSLYDPDGPAGPQKPFAPGLAIVGAPNIQFGNGDTFNTQGFVMHHGTGSTFAAAGSIHGGLIAVDEAALKREFPSMATSQARPTEAAVTFTYNRVTVSSSVRMTFEALPNETLALLGFTSGGGGATLQYWSED